MFEMIMIANAKIVKIPHSTKPMRAFLIHLSIILIITMKNL